MPTEPTEASESAVDPTTVLVAEDEPAIRRLLVTVLEQEGFSVLAAGSGDEAMLLADEHPGPFSLLVTDVVMPGLSGTELAEQLRGSRPELNVLFISGYTQHPEAVTGDRDESDGGRTRFLSKPFAPRRLIESLREILPPAAWPTGGLPPTRDS